MCPRNSQIGNVSPEFRTEFGPPEFPEFPK